MSQIIGIELKSPFSLKIQIFKLEAVSVQFKRVNNENKTGKKKLYFMAEIELWMKAFKRIKNVSFIFKKLIEMYCLKKQNLKNIRMIL